MYCTGTAYTRQLIALLLIAVMLFVHASKALHTHTSPGTHLHGKQAMEITSSASTHHTCTICEFQLAKDKPFTGQIVLAIAPVHIAPTYSRLLTAINPDRLFVTEGRGPPRA